MSARLSPLMRWLVWAALADWLLARTLSRLGIFIPKSPALVSAYQSLILVGQAAASFAGLLVVTVLLVWTLRAWSYGKQRPTAFAFATLVFLSIVFLFLQAPSLLSMFYQTLLLVALIYLGWAGWRRAHSLLARLTNLFPTLALMAGAGGYLAQLSGLIGWELYIFQVGELFVVLSGFLFWAGHGWPAKSKDWFLAALPALGFAIFRIMDPATTGILAIWSIGLTLYLPWPAYTLSLWLVGVAVLASARRGDPVSGAILLLVSGGFAPQLSSQAFFGLAGLGLLAGKGKFVFTEKGEDANKKALPQGRPAYGRE
jgi:hypothetical protein